MALTERHGIAVAEIVVYVPALAIAVFLTIRHGFGRNVGWLYMILLSLIRLVGASMLLATIAQPRNINLYVGVIVTERIGLSPLILVQLGLLSRLLVSMRKALSSSTILKPMHLRLVQLVIALGLILGTVGGSQMSTSASGATQPSSTTSVAGMALNIVGFALLVLAAGATAMQISHAAEGEKRILLAVALSLPFILVRVIYSAVGTFDSGNLDFQPSQGNPGVALGMSVIMEIIVVVIVEAVGLTLRKLDPEDKQAMKEQSSRRGNNGVGSGKPGSEGGRRGRRGGGGRRRPGLVGLAMQMYDSSRDSREPRQNSPDEYYGYHAPQEQGYSSRV